MVKLNMTFPEGFFEEEERCGHLISRETKKVWAVELDLLREFIRVCEKHNIKWWTDGGTLLGAVRHKGFIPWDDDMDVMMMRDDFEKLCKIAPEEFKEPYFFQSPETHKGYMGAPVRLRNNDATKELTGKKDGLFQYKAGIFFDIFPIENIPDDDNLLKEQRENILRYKRKATFLRDITFGYRFVWRKNLVKLFTSTFFHLLYTGPLHSRSDFTLPLKQFEDERQKYNGIETKRVCKTGMSIEPRRIWQRSWFNETVYLPFEMFQVPVPKEYSKILDTRYGDWHSFVNDKHVHVKGRFEKAEIEYIGGKVK